MLIVGNGVQTIGDNPSPITPLLEQTGRGVCHNLAHCDLLGMGYEVWDMRYGVCGVVGHGCSSFLVRLG